jgi:hypothetical protein
MFWVRDSKLSGGWHIKDMCSDSDHDLLAERSIISKPTKNEKDPGMKYLFSLITAAITILLIYAFQSKKVDIFYNKKVLNITFEGKMGQEHISFDRYHSTVIVWFHPECEHCRYQLDVISRNIHRLQKVRFLFITGEKDFFQKKLSLAWPDLVKSSHALFGIIDNSRFIDEFGPVITPSLLFFNHSGELKEKLLGEVKVDKIIQLIDKHPVPEQMMSGSN